MFIRPLYFNLLFVNKTKIISIKFAIHRKPMYICTMYSKELLKGTLSVIILKLLEDNEKMYGYQITQKVKELSEEKILFKEGSLYPALHKLKESGLIDVETVNIGKRIRRYYFLTAEGTKVKDEKVSEIKDFMITINKILSFHIKTQLRWIIYQIKTLILLATKFQTVRLNHQV